MSDIKDPKRLAGIERCLEDYFSTTLAPVMDKVEKEFRENRVREMRHDISSPAGMLSTMAGPMSDTLGTAGDRLRVTGEWTSKNAEDYAEECRRRFAGSQDVRQSIGLLTDEWRKAIVLEVGEKRYGELSSELGGDLASAYMEWRIGEMMTVKMAERQVPQSSAEYIMRKAGQNSLLSLNDEYFKSDLDRELETRAEEIYAPSFKERGAGRVLGAGMDAVLTCGTLSWTALAKFVGYDVVIGVAADATEKIINKEEPGVDQCISRGLFGTRHNVMEDVRHLGRLMDVESDEYTQSLGNALAGEQQWWYDRDIRPVMEEKEVAAPIMEETADEKKKEEPVLTEDRQPDSMPVQTNDSGWSGFLSTAGLDGMGDVGHNLGYVMAMLPDMLVGMFTGKTESLKVMDNLMPMAAIIGGLFVRNPLVKMLLIGMGGANLLNKAGHEALDSRRAAVRGTQYKVYEDEPLNSRIKDPVLKGGCLVMSIDKVPYSIQLPDSVVDAYAKGALPLNRLANAVLARTDEGGRMLAEKYESETRTETRIRGLQ